MRVIPDKASAAVYRAEVKQVPLKVSVSNPDNEDYLRSINAPDKVWIRGSAQALENVNSITTELIDVSDIDESGNIPMTYDLPEGVQIASASEGATIFVKVTPYVVREITVPASEIAVTNLGNDLTAEIQRETVTVRAVGTSDQVEALESGSFRVTLDAKDLSEGTYALEPEVTTDAPLVRAEVEERTVYMTLKGKS